MLDRDLAGPPWSWLALLGCVLAGTYIAPRPPAPTRVAVRVDCSEPRACDAARAVALDVWSERSGPGMPLDVVVASDVLGQATFRYEVMVPDIDAAARAEAARVRRPLAQQPADWFGEYHDYRAISDRLLDLARLAPGRATVHAIGSSLDGRTIWALRIGHGNTTMLVNGTQHAREWLAAMSTTCIADRLVRDYDSDPAIRAFVDRTELWVVPVVNPDGYQFTWAEPGNRYWRKNRRGGYGVDLNRNFGVGWGGRGASGSKLSETYRGDRPFSEPESAAMRDLAMREEPALHIDFHTYGQMLIYPWGYTATPSPDDALYRSVADRMAAAMLAPHQNTYKPVQGVEFYPASGIMTDWMYGEAHALSFTVELRPTLGGRGRGGFVLPPDQIRPTCDEALAAVLAVRDARP